MKNRKKFGLLAALIIAFALLGCCVAFNVGTESRKEDALKVEKSSQNEQKNMTKKDEPSEGKQGNEGKTGEKDEVEQADSSKQLHDEDAQELIVRPPQGTNTTGNTKPGVPGGDSTENPEHSKEDDVIELPFVPID